MLIFVELLFYFFFLKHGVSSRKGRVCSIPARHGHWLCQKISDCYSKMTEAWGSCSQVKPFRWANALLGMSEDCFLCVTFQLGVFGRTGLMSTRSEPEI